MLLTGLLAAHSTQAQYVFDPSAADELDKPGVHFFGVAKDEAGRPAPVPGLVLETRDDVRRCLEAIKRRALRQRYLDELDNARTSLTVAAELQLLAGERCRVVDGLDLA